MSKPKKTDKIRISFVDSASSEEVTGSMVYVSTPKRKILLDAGLYQSNDRYEDFLVNNRKFKEFKPKEIDLVFISHFHADHFAILPRLYKMGFTGRTIITEGMSPIAIDMLNDCAQINERDIEFINNQKGKNYEPIYITDDVGMALNNMIEYPVNEKITLDDEISFKLVPSGHLLGGVQILLYITIDGLTKTILYTGDLGNKVVENHFVGKYEQVEKADLVIGESTYGDRPDLKTGNKERKTDLKKLKTVVDTQVHDMRGRVVVPVFAQSRAQSIALMLYQLYKDSEWKPKVCIDSPLAIKIFDDYKECLTGDDKVLFDEMIESKFLNFIKETEDSKQLVSSGEPCVVLSTAGMCQVGRIRHHLKKCIPDPNATILFVGYATPDSLAGILRDPKRKSITMDTKEYACRCSIYCLRSLSGHAPFNQLVEDYTAVNCQKIVLHHGDSKAKETLKVALEKELEKQCKSTRVVIANSGLKFSL